MPAIKRTSVALLLLLGAAAEAANILALFPYPGRSHVSAFQPFVEELANRGHRVTVVTPYRRKAPLANYSEIIYEDTLPPRDAASMNFFTIGKLQVGFTMLFLYSVLTDACDKLLGQPPIQRLIHSTDLEFDLIIYETFAMDCINGFLHKFKVPSIKVFPNTIMSLVDDGMGNPSTMSYVPDALSQTGDMSFKNRIIAAMSGVTLYILRNFLGLSTMEAIMRKHFRDPSSPSIRELDRKASFLFLHTHPILNYPRPLTPSTIEIGGLHIKPAQKLPQDLQKFLDDAPHGVVYFSLGSNIRSVDMPDEMRNAILQVFSKLKQKVLWKWEADSMPGQPQNVRLGKWLPQHDILAHPNVRLFITHGGLMSIQEATYFGVPLLTIPVVGDQHFNSLQAQGRGYAVMLEVHNITQESLSWAINEVLQEPRYRARAQELSAIFRDQPQTPMERAVFWTEFALRHQGAAHLRSAALDLSFCEYYLLDVIAVLALAAFASLLVLAWLGRTLFKCLCSETTSKKSDSTPKKTN